MIRDKATPVSGAVRQVRLEPHLRTYVVECDRGDTLYVSPYELALEDDATRTPLGPLPEY